MHLLHLLLCFLVGVLCHLVTVPVPLGPHFIFGAFSTPNTTYVYDDVVAIEQNPFVYDPTTSWQELFTTRDFWGNVLAWASSHKSYRPITSLSYRLQVLWDGSGVRSTSVKRSLHAFNVLMFGVVCACFYHVCTRLEAAARVATTPPRNGRHSSPNNDEKNPPKQQQEQEQQQPNNHVSNNNTFSLLAGLLFAAHPIHTEAVACLVGRGEILSGLFFLLSLLAYEQFSQAATPASTPSTNSFLPSLSLVLIGGSWYLLALLLAFASMLCKEQGVTVLAIWMLYDVLVATSNYIHHCRTMPPSSSSSSSSSSPSMVQWVVRVVKHLFPRHLVTFAVLYALLSHRKWGMLPVFSFFFFQLTGG
jgi:hypothetical protein